MMTLDIVTAYDKVKYTYNLWVDDMFHGHTSHNLLHSDYINALVEYDDILETIKSKMSRMNPNRFLYTWLEYKTSLEMFDEFHFDKLKNRAARLIQAVWRGVRIRMKNRAARLIQAVWRGVRTRMKFSNPSEPICRLRLEREFKNLAI
jgi:hypothetical protein